MTGQDWVILGAGWLALAAIIAGLMLDQRRIERRLRRHRTELNQHHRRTLQLESTAQRPLTSSAATMPTVGGGAGSPVERRDWHSAMVIPDQPGERQEGASLGGKPGNVRALFTDPDPDDTVRLGRPPALGDIEHVLVKAGNRPHTGVELARALGRKPWDLLPELDRLVGTGRVELVAGHTAGHVAYRLVETVRMPHGMPVLWGASQ